MEPNLPEDVGNRFGDLGDLPEGLIRQIPAVRVDVSEREVLDVLTHRLEGVGTVDEILVGIYRHTGKVLDRGKLAGKLYRMVTRRPRLLESVPGKRGVYRVL